MSIAIISHPECIQHDPGLGHPECKERVIVIQQALETYPFKTAVTFHLAPLIEKEDLVNVHDTDYIDWIFAIAPKTDYCVIDQDTIMGSDTLNAARRAAGSVTLAVDLVASGKAQTAFCNVRPPGHHAERDRAMGFCFFNNVAVGVDYARRKYQLNRIAIIDFDVHHGNGTQNIFENDDNLLYCSSFQHPFYPGYDPALDNEHMLMVPLAAGTQGAEFREKVADAWFDAIQKFKPQLIFFSAGFDAHRNDPLAELQLENDDYVWITKEIGKLAKAHCDGKMISVLEGGYDLPTLASCVPMHVAALCVHQS